MKQPSDHYQLGVEDRLRGNPRYRFQDPHLQAEYDRGYDNGGATPWDALRAPGGSGPA